MAGKRTADSDLNHENWDQDDEPEEAGSFSKATEEVLKRRVIKVAKRRGGFGGSSNSESGPGVFAKFGGFSKTSNSAPAADAFNFLANLNKETKVEEVKTNGSTASPKTDTAPTTLFKMPDNKKNDAKSDEYYAKLKGLNESVSSWIKKHVDANPFLNLKPIFCDYEEHYNNLEKTYNSNEKSEKTEEKEIKKDDSQTSKASFASFAFKPSTVAAPTAATPTTTSIATITTPIAPTTTLSTSNFGWGKSQPSTSTSAFKFGGDSTAKGFTFGGDSGNKGFTFGGDTPAKGLSFGGSTTSQPAFGFSNVAKPEQTETKEEDEDEPPKVEFTPVVEEGHIYTIRCKVFVRKDGQFGERGVGNLYLKPVPDSDKVQLIVRADTSLGNLLCNFILSASIPMQRMGKKDVMLATLPTPDSKPPPVPVLLRVKSPEEADELLKTLEKHKK